MACAQPHSVYYDQQNVVTPPKGTPGMSPLLLSHRHRHRTSAHSHSRLAPAAATPPPTPPSMGPSDIVTPVTSTPNAKAAAAAPPKGDDWCESASSRVLGREHLDTSSQNTVHPSLLYREAQGYTAAKKSRDSQRKILSKSWERVTSPTEL